MAVPIIETITAEILTRLNEITVANGFQETLTVIRSRRIDFDTTAPGHNVGILRQMAAEPIEQEALRTGRRQHYECAVIVIDDSGSTVDTKCNQVAADIEKKLLADSQRNSLANDTVIESVGPPGEDSTWSGIVVGFYVDFEYAYGNPY